MNKRKRDCEALLAIGRLQILLEKNRKALEELDKLGELLLTDEGNEEAAIVFGRFVELAQNQQPISDKVDANIQLLACYVIGEEEKVNIRDMTIDELDLSARTYNVLKKVGLMRIEDLIEIPLFLFSQGKDANGVKIQGLGSKTQAEILCKLAIKCLI